MKFSRCLGFTANPALALALPQVKVVAVGAAYTSFEGYKDEATGETVIGLSYASLCQHVKPGGRILLADGSLTLQVPGLSVAMFNPLATARCTQPLCWCCAHHT